jgi:pimeloyl-ACP methyl ester carboxylesterase
VRVVADAFAWLSSRPDLGPAAAAGIGALSYAVSPAVLAALEPDIAQRVRFVLGIGGCYELGACVQFFTTGAAHRLEDRREADAGEYGKLVFARSSLAHVGPADRAILEAMIETRLRGRAADLPVLAARLSPAARSVYELLANTDPNRTASLLRALPASLQAELAALDLAQRDLSALRAQLLLVHGRNDPLVPYEQSDRLAGAVAQGQARLFIIGDVFRHVEFELSELFSREFVTRELPDAWKLWRAVDAVLDQRDIRENPPAGMKSRDRDARAAPLPRSSPAREKTR